MHSSEVPKLELKYCERCGGLWIRPQGGEEVYCGKCVNAIRELPPVKQRSNRVTGGGQAQRLLVCPELESMAVPGGGACA